MPPPPEPASAAVRSLLRRIGLELAFLDATAPGAAGTLAELLPSLDETFAGASAPADLIAAVATARSWLALPSAEIASRLGQWHPWMEEAVTAWERSGVLPDWPAGLAPLLARTSPSPPAAGSLVTTGRTLPTRELPTQDVTVLPAGWEPELMRLFCAEAAELLQDIEQGVLVLETAPTDTETLATVFRAFHTLKGNAAVMKLVVLQRLTHELESLLDAARRGSRLLDRDAIDAVLSGADIVAQYVAEANSQLDGRETGRTIPLALPAVIDRVHAILSSPAASVAPLAPPPGTVPLPATTPRASVAVLPPPASSPAPVNTGPDSGSKLSLPEPSAAAAPAPAAAAAASVPAAPTRPAAVSTGSVRVDTTRLDGLLDLVGELVIAQSMVVQAAAGGDEHLTRSLAQLRGITTDLQRTAMAMRMVPIRGAFQKMGRLVRDVAVQLGKEIRLIVEGEETELDRTVIEEISDPLVHMVRNAADHAIEPPDVREAAGKPRTGTITLRAFHQGGFVIVQVSDDGRGLDPARIRAKAVERGIVPADAVLDTRDTLELIFAPGFSTAEQISDLSGRGVGLDVVRRNVERIRGKVEVESAPGAGTMFTIFMPLTLAIIEGLVVSVGGQRFVIPTLAVRESFRPKAEALATVHGRGELVAVRGQRLPMMRLGQHLGIEGAQVDPTRGIVVVLEAGNDRRCILVDELVGKQEVVIKPLGEMFTGRTPFAGAAILGDGRVGLILDTIALVRLSRRSHTETAA
ncbi:MAG: chemotaxis protein CheA [Pirellulales bacterium]